MLVLGLVSIFRNILYCELIYIKSRRKKMKLKVLVDNNTYIDQYYCGEPAVSYYIEDEDIKLL